MVLSLFLFVFNCLPVLGLFPPGSLDRVPPHCVVVGCRVSSLVFATLLVVLLILFFLLIVVAVPGMTSPFPFLGSYVLY